MYGVETMSEHLFRKPASAVTLPEAAFIAGLIRAPSALSPWSNYDGALERSHVVLAQMREQGFITPAQEEAARRVRPRIQPYRQPNDARAGLGEGVPAAAVPQRVRRRQSARLAGAHDVPAGAAGRGGARRRRPGSTGCAVPGSRRRSSRSIRRPATSWRWSAARNYARSTYNRAVRSRRQPGSAFKPLVYAAALANGLFAGVGADESAARVGARRSRVEPAQREGEQPDALTLRAALLESNNPAAADLQQRVGSRAVLRLAGDAGLERAARRAVARARHRPRVAARSHRGLHDVSRRRAGGAAARHDQRVRFRRPPGVRSAGRARAAHQSGGRVSDDDACCATSSSAAPARRRARSAFAARSAARPGRPTIIATPGSSGFRRRSSSACGSDSISRRRSAATRTARAWRCRSGPTS